MGSHELSSDTIGVLERPQLTSKAYRRCVRCVMDTTDPGIHFDDQGRCNNCRSFLAARAKLPQSDEERDLQLRELVSKIRARGRNRRYDCIVGVSGGVDSTYVAYVAKQLGLRPLAVHLDNGWNSELAVSNIEKVLKKLDIDLYTHVLDWEEFREFQIALLKASTVDAEKPTDHAINAVLRQVAARENVHYILNGRNLSTEGLLPVGWSYATLDWKYLKGLNDRYGTRKLRSFPHLSLTSLLYSVTIRRTECVKILNMVPYSKARARDVLVDELGWVDYGGKHYESIYTRFFQGYILPRKFNIDKRKAHLSSLVCTNQVMRQEALDELERPPLPPEQADEDKEYVLKKLGLTEGEFETIMSEPLRSYRDFPNASHIFLFNDNNRMRRLLGAMKKLRLVPS